MNMQEDTIIKQAQALLTGETNMIANMANLSALLMMSLTDINWVGFYLYQDEELILGPFQGKPACVRIPLSKGVCGKAIREQTTQCIHDVLQFSGHIACDSASRSELVVPLIDHGQIFGVLDIDSASCGRFLEADIPFYEEIAKILLTSIPKKGER